MFYFLGAFHSVMGAMNLSLIYYCQSVTLHTYNIKPYCCRCCYHQKGISDHTYILTLKQDPHSGGSLGFPLRDAVV